MGKSSVDTIERVIKLELRASIANSRDNGNKESSNQTQAIPENVLGIFIIPKRLAYEQLFTKSQFSWCTYCTWNHGFINFS